MFLDRLYSLFFIIVSHYLWFANIFNHFYFYITFLFLCHIHATVFCIIYLHLTIFTPLVFLRALQQPLAQQQDPLAVQNPLGRLLPQHTQAQLHPETQGTPA